MSNTQDAMNLLFPAQRQQVLAALLLQPGHSLHLRELARLTGSHAGTLGRELGKLARAGLLLRTDQGNQAHYRANVQHPLFPELAALLRKTHGVVPALRTALQPLADRKTGFGQVDGRLEESRPGQSAILPMRHFEHAHGSGNADRPTTDHCLMEAHRLAIRPQEEILAHRCRRRLAAIESHRLPAIVVQQEGTAANPARLRFDETENHLRRDRGIDRGAASAQHRRARLARQRVRRRNRETLSPPAGLLNVPGDSFRLVNLRRRGRQPRARPAAAASQERKRDQEERGELHGSSPISGKYG